MTYSTCMLYRNGQNRNNLQPLVFSPPKVSSKLCFSNAKPTVHKHHNKLHMRQSVQASSLHYLNDCSTRSQANGLALRHKVKKPYNTLLQLLPEQGGQILCGKQAVLSRGPAWKQCSSPPPFMSASPSLWQTVPSSPAPGPQSSGVFSHSRVATRFS